MKTLLVLIFLPFLLNANFQNGIYKFTNLKDKNEKNTYSISINNNVINLNSDLNIEKLKFEKHYITYHFGNENYVGNIYKFAQIKLNDEIINIDFNKTYLEIPTKIINQKSLNKLNNFQFTKNKESIIFKNETINKNQHSLQNYETQYISYFGNPGYNWLRAVTEDRQGNIILGGETGNDVLPLPNLKDTNPSGFSQVIIKTSKNMEIIWVSLIGGSGKESIFDLCVDDENMIWGVGETSSTNYPITNNALQNSNKGGPDGAIFRLNEEGVVTYGSYYGTDSYEALLGIDFFNGKLYSVGQTGENRGYFIIFEKDGTKFSEGYFGGSTIDSSEDLAIDSSGNMYLTGWVSSDKNKSYQVNNYSGDFDSYIVRFNIYSKTFDKMIYIGGSKNEQSYNIEVDNEQNIYVTGSTTSLDFPVINSSSSFNGNQDYFITKINQNFDIEWSHYIGGGGIEGEVGRNSYQGGLAIKDDNIFMASLTGSDNLPLINPLFDKLSGNYDSFIQSYSKQGELLFSTYFGGFGRDVNLSLYCHSENSIIAVGGTQSNNIPVTEDAFQKTYSGSYDGYVLKFAIPNPQKPCEENSFEYIGFHDKTGLNLVGDAVTYDSTLRLNKSDRYQKGGVWIENPLNIGKGFEFEFTFEVSQGNDNGLYDGYAEGADGIVFVVQGESNNVIGVAGGGIGYENLQNALAVELDLYHNDEVGYNDPNGNHIAAFSSKEKIYPDHNSNNFIAQNTEIDEIKIDKTRYNFKVRYDNEARNLKVYLNEFVSFDKLVLNIDDFDITEHITLGADNSAFLGVVAATGNAIQRHELFSLKYCGGDFISSIERNETSGLVYPNPTKDVLYLNTKQINKSIKIVDLLGNEYLLENINNKVDISMLKTGMYFIEIRENNKILFQKFIKE